MSSKGPGKPVTSSPYGNPSATKSLKSSPYGKLPDKSKKKAKKSSGKDSENNGNNQGEGVALKEVFSVLGDENGRITSAKLRSFVKELELDFTEEEIQDMITVVDPSGAGDISYDNMIGIVRDFSHEFPAVQLTQEELKRELTDETVKTDESLSEENVEEAETREQTNDETDTEEKTETATEIQISRPLSSRARAAAANAKRIMEELEDKMSVIKEDDEPEDDDDNGEGNGEDKGQEEDKSQAETEDTDKDFINSQSEQDSVQENGDHAVSEHNSNDSHIDNAEDNKSLTSSAGAMIVLPSEENESTKGEVTMGDDTHCETEDAITKRDRRSQLQSRASTVREHRLDSAISTAVGRMSEKEGETSRRSRKHSKSENSNKERRDSVKSERNLSQRSKSKERSNSKSRKPDKGRKSIPRRKSVGADDPEFYSTMGCSLKLSQIRTRQRILYVMWRAVYDQAIRRMQQEQAKENQKRKKFKKVKSNPSVSAF